LLVASGALILNDQIHVYGEHGFTGLRRMTSPRSVSYYCAVAIALMPGASLIALGQWLVSSRRRHRLRRTSYRRTALLRR
jgi:hypothetical protein